MTYEDFSALPNNFKPSVYAKEIRLAYVFLHTFLSVIFWRQLPSTIDVIVDVGIRKTLFPLSVSASAIAPR